MKLERQNVAIVGALNPAIISPDWLVEQKVCKLPAEEEVKISIQVVGAQAIRFELDSFAWVVSGTKLVIESDGRSDPAPVAAMVFEKLSHTPIRGAGSNFHFVKESNEAPCPTTSLESLPAEVLKDRGTIRTREHATSATLTDGTLLTVKVRVDETTSRVFVNFHRPVSSVRELQSALKQFGQDRKVAHEIVAQLTEAHG